MVNSNSDDFILENRKKLVKVSQNILNGQIELIEGCREIVNLRGVLNAEDDDIFDPILVIDSETDHFPRGEVRSYYNKEKLKEIDESSRVYLEKAKPDIIEACNQIVKKFS